MNTNYGDILEVKEQCVVSINKGSFDLVLIQNGKIIISQNNISNVSDDYLKKLFSKYGIQKIMEQKSKKSI